VNWKDIENLIKDQFDKLKCVYSRADKYEGQIAISSYKMDKKQYEKLSTLKDHSVGEKKFTFSELKGDALKEFWQKQGGHFQYCIQPKLRLAKKNTRKTE